MPIVAEQTATVATYSGWSNRETWIMNLWLANDETYCDEVRSIIKTCDEYEQAERLESLIRDEIEGSLEESGLLGDLLAVSLGRISWQEIIENNRYLISQKDKSASVYCAGAQNTPSVCHLRNKPHPESYAAAFVRPLQARPGRTRNHRTAD